MLTSIHGLATRWRWHRESVRRFLNERQKVCEIVYSKTSKKCTIVTWLQYDEYQGDAPITENQSVPVSVPQSVPESVPIKEVKKIRRRSRATASEVSGKPIERFNRWIAANQEKIWALGRQHHLTEGVIREDIDKMRAHVMADGRTRKWAQFVNNWLKRTREWQIEPKNPITHDQEQAHYASHRQRDGPVQMDSTEPQEISEVIENLLPGESEDD